MTKKKTDEVVCLRQGYQCSCNQCQVWIKRWDNEVDFFKILDDLLTAGKNILQIVERLRASHPDLLRLHVAFVEAKYFERVLKDKVSESSEEEEFN